MYLAGLSSHHLISGRETLKTFSPGVGGFSNSDVLGSQRDWSIYTMKKQNSFRQFLQREDTLSVGICNGCQFYGIRRSGARKKRTKTPTTFFTQ
jgi:phosphoribosylformylglycinamidine synthase